MVNFAQTLLHNMAILHVDQEVGNFVPFGLLVTGAHFYAYEKVAMGRRKYGNKMGAIASAAGLGFYTWRRIYRQRALYSKSINSFLAVMTIPMGIYHTYYWWALPTDTVFNQ
eukprot:CAMPEP_0168529242 /NCGR_PEP_ID=MMETSP0405-20121227/13778_1 /TAXON_ID=498012 /ORGANISM="Trichosphaerium sp, Strain Am-I-7 wt" /LENGTH=111 /DNA_ID=CAMNT_0008552901 /DNA_START=42 /DNA_END=377 /DNA_ORIENTATION=-